MGITIIKTNSGKFKAIIRSNNRLLKTKTFKRKTDAKAWAKRWEREYERMEATGDIYINKTLNDLIRELRSDLKHDNRSRFWRNQFGQKKLREITSNDIEGALATYGTGKVKRCNGLDGGGGSVVVDTRKKRTPASVNRMKASISAILAAGVRKHWITHNVAREVAALPENNKRTRYLTDGERSALLSACKLSSWEKLYLLVVLALATGARQAELLNLRWSDIDFVKSTALLRKTKNGDQRVLTFPTPVITELVKYRETGNGLVFASKNIPDKPFCFRKVWLEALREAKIENFRFHDLRHSCASYLAMHGASLIEIGQVLGHRSPQTTHRYAHLSTRHKAELTERVMSGLIT